ncbi:Ser/Thr protein kinase RdoA involved in Cpx stress response, MazF antagonist [Chitinophaga costaii]|uniref:Ser/Thr protein kinase RdoA involved in Cpx stress response, MazF antagonist n=1 Tax=Chitinophaga costaii TaxID=1335309 RepID=A0A1C3ZLZ5_9BACT|nr:aminoglycoside phosphotransferase family protein [Chitinophaga costaii]PUZ30427.1 aminoglycoside phosphotransferase family protein [Chitinophaga costaii]SCB83331.1 Ser/Thr protein kinase RdoA involved in Cpx stress response, MazF antagonist [Chitinophaga costaii]
MLPSILHAYGLNAAQCKITPFGSGLINRTWKVEAPGGRDYILQQINQDVFQQPDNIAVNISSLAAYLRQHAPGYLFPEPVASLDGAGIVRDITGYFRLLPFIGPSKAYDVVTSPAMAYEAARQFGRFTRLLEGFPYQQLRTTLAGFHDLSLRYTQFQSVLREGDLSRIAAAHDSIALVQQFRDIETTYRHIRQDPQFKLRVTHHDTKISNVLFDEEGQGLCVIDLDTVMPGYFISDLGDMLRTYLSPVTEEEEDFSKINIRDAYFSAIIAGYLSEMKDSLTAAELQHLVYAGKFMIYMQALRFLTDHLNNDRYYGARYGGHNLVRANNQLVLLQQLTAKEDAFKEIIQQALKTPLRK